MIKLITYLYPDNKNCHSDLSGD